MTAVGQPANRGTSENWPALIPVVVALALTAYISLRYGYRWSEQDSSQFSSSIRGIMAEGTLNPSTGAYPHGFNYQAIVASVAMITGLDVVLIQIVVFPFLSIVVALAAFVAFRALTGSSYLGAVSTVLLLIQPEFLFVIHRGSHEKITHTLVLILVLLLIAAFVRSDERHARVGYVLAFYVIAWGLITTTSFFSSSLIAGLLFTLLAGVAILRATRSAVQERKVLQRLAYKVLALFAMLFAFIGYVYLPARHNFFILQTLYDKLATLFLSFEPEGNPYATIGAAQGAAWVHPWLYPALTLFNWLVIAAAAATWCWLGMRFKREGLGSGSRSLLLLWLLTASFAVMMVMSVIVDISGFLSQNLQIRIFPMFMLFGIPLAAVGASRVYRNTGRFTRRPFEALVVIAFAFFATVGVLKATNDPVVSNKWLFYSDYEREALAWTDRSLERETIWIEFDERLREMQAMHQPVDRDRRNRYTLGLSYETSRYTLMSDIISRRALRLRFPAPDTRSKDRIYDNGEAQIYHAVPRTPYEP